MALYEVEPTRAALHGKFSRDHKPILTILSGDRVQFRTLDAGWGLEQGGGARPRRRFEPMDPVLDSGHALCGPIAIEGAEPGMTLEVQITALRPGNWGWSAASGWPSLVNSRLGLTETPEVSHRWTLDPEKMTGRNQHGHQVTLRPFLGVMGMPTDEPGLLSTTPPRVTGGNMDCKELVVGTSLYLPIGVSGGLFSTGDGHAAQGDGEVSGIAIECPMERAELTFILHPELHLTTPRANTPAGWLTMGFHESVDEAMFIALESMLDLMGEQYGLSRPDALALASIVVDLRITQIVNEVCGVHALLPHGALKTA